MTVLLDTHAVVWAALNSIYLSAKARHFIEHADEVLVSAASAWEIATKVRLGRWPEALPLESKFEQHMRLADYKMLPISTAEALRAGRLRGLHGDPFDRMIVAQALARDVPVISIDAMLDTLGIRRIW